MIHQQISDLYVDRAAFEQLKGRPGMLINLVRPYNPKADDPCDFSSAGISHEFNSCFWWNMAQYHYTQFGLTCLNDTNVYDTAIPSSMAQSLSFSATTTFSSTAVPTSGFYTTGTTPSVVQASNSPTATDGPDKESIGLQKQGNKIGLAVGLCVGVPALLLALVQIRIHIRHTQASGPPSIPLSPGTQFQQGSSVPPGSTSANGNHQTQASLTPQQPQQNGLLLQQQTPAAVQTSVSNSQPSSEPEQNS